jgi:hypothetical protein
MSTQAVAKWRGWFRPNKSTRWQALAEGDTYDEAFHRLHDELARRREKLAEVVISQRDPNTRRR